MIHAITLEDGRASYRNRWVESAGLREERTAGSALYPGLLEHRRRPRRRRSRTPATPTSSRTPASCWRSWRPSLPTELVPCTLATVGEYDFGGKLARPDDRASEDGSRDRRDAVLRLLAVSAVPAVPRRRHATARSSRSEAIDVAWPSMMHDFAITTDYVIFMLCPLVFSFENMQRRAASVFTWEPERGTQLGVMPRSGGNADVRWFDTDPCYVFHPHERVRRGRRRIVLDVARYEQLDFMEPAARRASRGWRDENARGCTAGGSTSRRRRRASRRRSTTSTASSRASTSGWLGRKHRFGYMAARDGDRRPWPCPQFTAIRRYDLERGTHRDARVRRAATASASRCSCRAHATPPRTTATCWRPGLRRGAQRERLLVLDARDIAGEPIATVRLPHRVPYGFHGNWAAAD